jgi:hypothetical protein
MTFASRSTTSTRRKISSSTRATQCREAVRSPSRPRTPISTKPIAGNSAMGRLASTSCSQSPIPGAASRRMVALIAYYAGSLGLQARAGVEHPCPSSSVALASTWSECAVQSAALSTRLNKSPTRMRRARHAAASRMAARRPRYGKDQLRFNKSPAVDISRAYP